jgi:thiamine biosynthesis lipoprotein
MERKIGRRRFLTISAAAAGLALVPFGAPRRAAAGSLVEWHGISLGSVATIRIHHPDRAAAADLINQVVAESQRLEQIFSLYREDSTLCELNRNGVLLAPPAELSDLLASCDRFWRLTGGAFDPTVQPLWRCYADHFAVVRDASQGPSSAKIRDALDLVGWGKVRFDRDKVVFARRGMGLTLNGIAQGYITDRVVERLRACGIKNCLVDMGEIRALGARPDGQPWRIAIEGAQAEVSRFEILAMNRAVATSGAHGFQFDERGHCNHLFNPVTGTCAEPLRNVSVVADMATTADALSTAFALMNDEAISSTLVSTDDVKVLVSGAGDTWELTALTAHLGVRSKVD